MFFLDVILSKSFEEVIIIANINRIRFYTIFINHTLLCSEAKLDRQLFGKFNEYMSKNRHVDVFRQTIHKYYIENVRTLKKILISYVITIIIISRDISP